jgi:hypothetical protein
MTQSFASFATAEGLCIKTAVGRRLALQIAARAFELTLNVKAADGVTAEENCTLEKALDASNNDTALVYLTRKS